MSYKFEVGDRVLVSKGHGYRPGEIFTITDRGQEYNHRYYSDGTDPGHPGSKGVYERALTKIYEPIGDPDDSKADAVNHPSHYNSHPSGVECITIARHHNFNIGNVFKYLWRIGLKGADADSKAKRLEEIDKALVYLKDERDRVAAEA